ncbi:IclR family transcriptional regulator [Veronia nyctiphanis]|uniref:HTH-type transcriptional repressor AllR n=1 Tax=Veronia nyctiphanis TaxID=1278244 RepID=A0A4Q0YEW6_9GAMM|nr:IclR family transcriptional regulator [Veronia nyctiphanis]RXJ69096.1 IclR family transcriptional regulator [Veronia nyctiphanis]
MEHTQQANENAKRKDSDTPTLRLFSLLEVIACKDEFFSLQGLTEETGIPKPTLHRMLTQLESAGIVQKDGDGKQFSSGNRLRKLAENILLNSTMHSARRSILRRLQQEVGESCNLTSIVGDEIVYVDRVETEAPLRFHLHAGSRVPVHCSASGKLFLASMSESKRKRIVKHLDFSRHTEKTICDPETLEDELVKVSEAGYAVDNEEFLPGLICVGMMVPSNRGISNMAVAIQAPVIRMTLDNVEEYIPALRRASESLAAIEEDAWPV